MASDTFCPLPFCHLQVDNDGSVNPCCVSDMRYADANGVQFNMAVSTLSDVWASDHIAELRNALSSGIRHPGCGNCWSMEDGGQDSHRHKMLRMRGNLEWATGRIDHDHPTPTSQPEFISLRLGNICNLKCRICGPGSSSKWVQEYLDTNDDGVREFDTEGRMRWFERGQRFWKDLADLLPGTKEMMLTGGEPFLIGEQIGMLRDCAASGTAGGIHLQFHTNGTVMTDEMIWDILPRYGRVTMIFSLDGTGRQFEFQRHGASWHEVDSNVRRCIHAWRHELGPRGHLSVNLTVSAMNAYYLPEYAEYFTEVGIDAGLSFVMGRKELKVTELPWVVRHAIAHRLRNADPSVMACYTEGTPVGMLISTLMEPPSVQSTQGFRQAMARMDAYRGESFADAFPEMAALVGYRGP